MRIRIGCKLSRRLSLSVRRLYTQRPYGFIVLVASVALTGVYVFVADVAVWLKALFVGLLLVSLVWRYGLFLQVALTVCLSLYFTYLKARYFDGER